MDDIGVDALVGPIDVATLDILARLRRAVSRRITYHDPLVLRDNLGEKRPYRLSHNALGHRAAAWVSTGQERHELRGKIEWGINPSFPLEFK
jgi:hypothetical protein